MSSKLNLSILCEGLNAIRRRYVESAAEYQYSNKPEGASKWDLHTEIVNVIKDIEKAFQAASEDSE